MPDLWTAADQMPSCTPCMDGNHTACADLIHTDPWGLHACGCGHVAHREDVSEHLFALPTDAFAVTSDDCYTPRWVFDAMGLRFDLDVAAPPGGPWHVPAERWYTAEDDGLSQPWVGLIWCNPPYSAFEVWADRWIAHDRGVLLGYQLPQVRWTRKVFAAANAVAMTGTEFIQPDGNKVRLRQPVFVAFRGVGTEPAERLAAADPCGAVLYGRRAA